MRYPHVPRSECRYLMLEVHPPMRCEQNTSRKVRTRDSYTFIMYIYIYTYDYIYIYNIYIYLRVCIYIYTYIHACMHTYLHTYISFGNNVVAWCANSFLFVQLENISLIYDSTSGWSWVIFQLQIRQAHGPRARLGDSELGKRHHGRNPAITTWDEKTIVNHGVKYISTCTGFLSSTCSLFNDVFHWFTHGGGVFLVASEAVKAIAIRGVKNPARLWCSVEKSRWSEDEVLWCVKHSFNNETTKEPTKLVGFQVFQRNFGVNEGITHGNGVYIYIYIYIYILQYYIYIHTIILWYMIFRCITEPGISILPSRQRFQREIQIAKKLDHPNVVRCGSLTSWKQREGSEVDDWGWCL